MDLNKLRDKIKPAELLLGLGAKLNRRRGLILFMIFLIVTGYCGYLWFRYIKNPRWSEVRRQDYLSVKQKEVTFEKNKFDEVIKDIETRKFNYQKNLENIPDIFRMK